MMIRLKTKLDPIRTGHDAERLFTDLHQRIVGQDDAIDQIVNIYQMYLAGMNTPSRPIGNLLFLGPTGSGKTRLVEAAAESLVGDARAMIKIDCAEFQHSHEIANLILPPPGYLGHRETHPLMSQEALNQYHTDKVKISFVLFDEIEKASDATPFAFSLTEDVTDYLLKEGTDMKYGARRLKRAIDCALVQPMSNLIATQQVRTGDLVKVDFDAGVSHLRNSLESQHRSPRKKIISSKRITKGTEQMKRKKGPSMVGKITALINAVAKAVGAAATLVAAISGAVVVLHAIFPTYGASNVFRV